MVHCDNKYFKGIIYRKGYKLSYYSSAGVQLRMIFIDYLVTLRHRYSRLVKK